MKLWKAMAFAPTMLIALAPLAQPANAGFPKIPKPKIAVPDVPTDPSQAWSQAMYKVNSLSQEGLNALPGGVSEESDPEKVKDKLDKGKKKYEEAKKYYTTVPDPRSVNEGATNYYLELEARVNNGYLALACLKTYKPIAKSFGEGKPVKDDKLDAFDAASKAYIAKAIGEDGARDAKSWQDTAVKFRELNPQVAEKKLKGELDIKRQAESAAEKAAMDALYKHITSWVPVMKENVKPIDAAALADYDTKLKELVAFRAEAPLFFDDKKWEALNYNAWFLGGDAAKAELAKLWEGEVVASGTTSKKEFKVNLKAEAGMCYALVPQWIERGGESKMEGDWRAKKDGAYAHLFRVEQRLTEGSFTTTRNIGHGLCATKPVTIDFEGELEYAGSNKGIEYHIVRWEKSKFPLIIASRLYTWTTDDCDPNHWKDRFMNPIPGTFYYGSGLPVVGKDNPDGSEGGGSEVTVPEAWKFKEGWMAPGSYSSWRTQCGGEDALNPLGKQLEACFIANDKAFEPKWNAANAAVERATILTHEGAVARRDAIDTQWQKAQETKCMPIAKKITAQMIAAYNELVDYYKTQKPVPQLDVKGFKRKQELAVERSSR